MTQINYTLRFVRTDEFVNDDDDFVVIEGTVPVCVIAFDAAYFELNSSDADDNENHRMNEMISFVERTFNVHLLTHCVMAIDACTAMIVPYRK